MSLKIKIGQHWKRTITTTEHGQGVDETVEASFVAVFRDLPPDEVNDAQQQITDLLKPIVELRSNLLRLSRQVKSEKIKSDSEVADSVDIEQLDESIDGIKNATPMIDRVLIGIEGVSIERADGAEMGPDEVLEYMKRSPKYRNAIMAVWEAEQPKVNLGNYLLSGGRLAS